MWYQCRAVVRGEGKAVRYNPYWLGVNRKLELLSAQAERNKASSMSRLD